MSNKSTGIGDAYYLQGVDISGDTNALTKISAPMTPLDVTTINQSAVSRLGGLRDGAIDFTVFMDPATSHPQLSALPRTDVICTYFHVPGTIGNPAFSMTGKQLNYDGTRGADGSLTYQVSVQGNGFGMEWGQQLTPGKQTDSAAGTTATLDNTTSTAFGAQGYLQFFGVTGTSTDVVVQHSTAPTTGFATLIDFGAQTAAGAVRTTAAGTVNRYLRVVSSGTFSSATYAVQVTRNTSAISF